MLSTVIAVTESFIPLPSFIAVALTWADDFSKASEATSYLCGTIPEWKQCSLLLKFTNCQAPDEPETVCLTSILVVGNAAAGVVKSIAYIEVLIGVYGC